jgi:hypothetical protein
MITYTPCIALQAAVEIITNPPLGTKDGQVVQTEYEHHVGTLACTELKEVFSDEKWAITPEQIDTNTAKRPYLVVEEAIYEHGHYVATAETVDTKGNTFPDEFEVFVVVQSGLKITFFEYHNYQNNLDEEIRNFRGCVSLFPSHKAKISRVSFKRSCLTYHPT